jgi:hypothetical protein
MFNIQQIYLITNIPQYHILLLVIPNIQYQLLLTIVTSLMILSFPI